MNRTALVGPSRDMAASRNVANVEMLPVPDPIANKTV